MPLENKQSPRPSIARLRLFRVARKMSQQELARLVPCSQATISNFERLFCKPTRGHAAGIARALGLDVFEIFPPDQIFPPFSKTLRKKKTEDPRVDRG